MLQHSTETSLLQAIDNALTLDIYLDQSDGSASGYIYMDDGQTFNYRDQCEKTLVEFTFQPSGEHETTFEAEKKVRDECKLDAAASKQITRVNVYGVTRMPESVQSS